jgi:hypothetical protein
VNKSELDIVELKAVLATGLGAKKADLDVTEEVRIEDLDFEH